MAKSIETDKNKQTASSIEVAVSSTSAKPGQKEVVTEILEPAIDIEKIKAQAKAEARNEVEQELKGKFEVEKEAELKEKAQVKDKTVSSDADIAKAITKQHDELKSKDKVRDRIITIRPKDVAKGEARVGQLLPNIKRGFGVYKNAFGIYETGFTDEQLKDFKDVPVWDHERNRPNNEFWEKYQLVLTSTDKILNLDKSEKHRIDYMVAKGHTDIANTEAEINSRTLFYIVDEEAEAIKANAELDALTTAYTYIQKMAPSERRAFLSLFGVHTKDSSDNVIVLHLRMQAEESPQKFVKLYEDDNKMDKILINEMVEYNVLQKRDGAFWFNEALIGTDFTSTVHWMGKSTNQDIKLKLMQQLEVFKKQ